MPTTPSPNPTTQGGGVLRVALFSDVESIDPVAVTGVDALTVSNQIYETLVDYEAGGFRIVPRLAESWTVSSDGSTWTFALRRGVKFHDGSDVDAAAVVASLERARRAGRDASVFSAIVAKGLASVAITTRTSYGPLLALLATGGLAISGTGAVGTGPFAPQAGARGLGAQIPLERNPSYWDRDRSGARLPYLDRIVFRTVRDEPARMAELRSGGLDLVRELTLAQLATVKADPNLVAATRPARAIAYLGVSQAGGPVGRIELRRAIASAIDRSRLASALYAPDLHVVSQLVPPGMLGYDDSVVDLRYDVTAAKRALADAGFGAGVSMDLWYPGSWSTALPEPKRVAEGIAMDLAKIGVQVTLRGGEPATYREDARANRFALWLDEASAELADPDAYLGADMPANPVAAELLRRARAETDPSKRGELYKQVTKLTQQDVSRIPLFSADGHLALSGKVRGYAAQPIGPDSLMAVWVGK